MPATTIPVQYSLMAGSAYFSTRGDVNRIPFPDSDGWQRLPGYNFRQDDFTGFEAAAFTRGTGSNQEIVISFAGTYNGTDWAVANMPLSLGAMSPQLLQAAQYYEDIKRSAYPNTKISFTGHSLGGGLAALMGVFFNKEAITFDPAPFRLAANMTNSVTLMGYLLANGYGIDLDLATFYSISPPLAPPLFIRGESKISAYAVDGEVLTNPASNLLRINQRLDLVTHGPTTLGMIDLHSTELLTALKQSENFRQATWQLPFMLTDVFDSTLFARPVVPSSGDRNLLTHLIRREFGVPGTPGSDTDLLTKFGNDMVKLGIYGTADAALKQGLERIALRYYYYNSTSGAVNEFFDKVSGGVRFDLARAGSEVLTSSSQANAYGMLATWLAANTPAAAQSAMTEFVGGSARRFTLALGSSVTATAPADDIADFMLAGTVGGNLAGGAGNDLLVGRGGMDILTGGVGDDQLYGDAGYDTYVVGQGLDKIIDSDGSGMIQDESGDRLTGQFVKQADGTYALLGNSSVTAVKGAGLVITLANGAKAWLPDFDNFTNGELGIALYEETAAPTTSRTIIGTDQAETIYDRTEGGAISNDLIQGLGGNDNIATFYGGDDQIEGGDGDDWIIGGDGNDLVIGGAGRDVLLESGGDDQLYADDMVTLTDALDTENATPSGLQGEALAGNWGDDLAIGGIGNDVLFGGTGDDILIGGAGDDNIGGDILAVSILSDWSATRSVSGNSYLITYDQFRLDTPSEGGADVIYAGAGVDWVGAGNGNDYVDGGNDDDVIWGEGGNDDIFGGAGADLLMGDYVYMPLSAHGDDYMDGEEGDDILFGEGSNDQLFGGTGNDRLSGNEDNDYLDGEDDNDILFGEAGNDTLIGGAGADYLLGGLGDDLLDGGEGDDVYFYTTGEGNDRIVDSGGADWLVFSDITWDQIRLGTGSLKLGLPDGGEIHLDDFDPDNPYAAGGIEYFQFADGAVLTKNHLIDALGIQPTGTPEANVLSGTALVEVIRALRTQDTGSRCWRDGDDACANGVWRAAA